MKLKRETDGGVMCVIALRAREFWDFVDRRQADAWISLIFSLVMTYLVLDWAMDFANSHPDMDGLKMAAIVGAVVAPWVTMQAAFLKFIFDARQKTFLPGEKS